MRHALCVQLESSADVDPRPVRIQDALIDGVKITDQMQFLTMGPARIPALVFGSGQMAERKPAAA